MFFRDNSINAANVYDAIVHMHGNEDDSSQTDTREESMAFKSLKIFFTVF